MPFVVANPQFWNWDNSETYGWEGISGVQIFADTFWPCAKLQSVTTQSLLHNSHTAAGSVTPFCYDMAVIFFL